MDSLANMPKPRAGDSDVAAFWEAFRDALDLHWQVVQRSRGIRGWRAQTISRTGQICLLAALRYLAWT